MSLRRPTYNEFTILILLPIAANLTSGPRRQKARTMVAAFVGLLLLFRARTATSFLKASYRELSVLHESDRTYDRSALEPMRDVIDEEGAMEAFFSSRAEWTDVFRSVAGESLPFDINLLLDSFSSSTGTIQQPVVVDGIPQNDDDRAVLSTFLDSMHQSLLDIPVVEGEDDEHEQHFVEEGRRLLAISRFRVLRENEAGCIDSIDELFRTIWGELNYLRTDDTRHTGSIVLLPNYCLSDLKRFTDMNVVQPLAWLGNSDFEVVSLERGSPAIRMIYKLTNPEDMEYDDDQDEGLELGEEK